MTDRTTDKTTEAQTHTTTKNKRKTATETIPVTGVSRYVGKVELINKLPTPASPSVND